MDHEYDGIQEFDNPTPGWWHAMFIGSVVFAVFYAMYWHGNPDAPTIHDRWRQSQVAEFRRVFGAIGELQPDEPTILKMMGDEKMMAVAKSTFIANCAACHGRDGAGISGSACPNLTDDSWKNVTKLADVLTVINKGANSGAMPAWENRLSQNERIIVAAYVASLRANPLPGRAAEGQAIPPWPQPAAQK
jgi:cytochrome c oxidase cbb3-type subunit 3